jgi:pimeloyl-ACP methyl ester carboxylesterase
MQTFLNACPASILYLVCLSLVVTACSKKMHTYPEYNANQIPPPPEYSSMNSWAAHPDKSDAADLVPGKGQFEKIHSKPEVDVFFVHPTLYTKKPYPSSPWHGDINNPELNEKVDNSTIKYQASVFNGSTNVYAPRYRQAHLNVFIIDNGVLKDQALQLAYEDVKAAFEYYLKHYNNGKPFILASHSQGTVHAARLAKEYLEGKPLVNQLVAAYLVGIALKTDQLSQIKPCASSSETGCWISWNTFERNYYPPQYKEVFDGSLSTNPLTWSIDTLYAPASRNEGSILRNFKKVYSHLCDAQNHQGLLWINKPRFFGSAFYRSKRYHIADYNLFYANIRKNVAERILAYQQQQKDSGLNKPALRDE